MAIGAGRGGLAPVLALDNGELFTASRSLLAGWSKSIIRAWPPRVSVGETRYFALTPSTNIRWRERLSASRL